jgi:NitT/TauT family transport system substrate-binding protein
MQQDGGKVLVNEASLWPGGKFVTTNLVVAQSFLAAHPSVVTGLLKANIQAINFIHSNTSAAETAANAELTTLTGKGLKSAVLPLAFKQITFTSDPIASSLATDAKHAEAVGLLKPVNLNGIFDLTALNSLLTAAGQPTVGG